MGSERFWTFTMAIWMNLSIVDALQEHQVCYILDGLLFVYGILLTVLYCRLKMRASANNSKALPQTEKRNDGVYMDLTHRAQDTYESIKQKIPRV